jgi:hypothetical protein
MKLYQRLQTGSSSRGSERELGRGIPFLKRCNFQTTFLLLFTALHSFRLFSMGESQCALRERSSLQCIGVSALRLFAPRKGLREEAAQSGVD